MKYYVDGFTTGSNPSKVGGGFTIYKNKKHLKTFEIRKINFTCNEAELLGVLDCLKIASQNDTIYTDSMNTIYWVRRGEAKARPDLNKEILEAHELADIKKIKIEFVPRDNNLAGIYNEFTLKV